MSTIADFISGTVNESLKKLLQPVGLIPAAIFVLLNLGFVYPAARADGVPLAEDFAALDGPLQAAIVALVTFALGYVLLSASSMILDILGGQLIRGSVTHSFLVWRQRRTRTNLLRADAPNPWYVSKRFYLPREDGKPDPLPTALGNVLVATQGTLERRYGIDMAALWSQLVATPELKELPAKAVVEDERAARDTLGNIAFVLWLFALEALAFFTFRDEPRHALMALIAVPAGYVVYRFAVAKAHAWGSAVETLVDLHRDRLHTALKLAPYGSLSAERELWGRAGNFFVTASDDPPGDGIFKEEDAPSVTAIPSGDLAIPAPVSAVVDGPRHEGDSVWLRWVEYVVLVAKASSAVTAATAEVLLDDPRVARIDASVETDEQELTLRVVRGSAGNDQLLWTLRGLEPGAAVSLRARLPLFALRWEPWSEQEPEEQVELLPGVGFAVAVPAGVERVRVTCFAASTPRPEIRIADTRTRPSWSDGRTYEWSGLAGRSVWLLLPDRAGA